MKTYLVTSWEDNTIINKEATGDDIIHDADSMGAGDYFLFLKDSDICIKIKNSLNENEDIHEILDNLGLKENEDYELIYSGFDCGDYISKDRVKEYKDYKYYFHKNFDGIEFADTESLYQDCNVGDIYIEEHGDEIHYILCNTEILDAE